MLISDGREEYLRRTLESVRSMLPTFEQYVLVDDAPRERTEEVYRASGMPMPLFRIHGNGSHELGFGGAIQAGWAMVETDYVFHLEQDFLFRRPVPLADMVSVLEAHPHLAQMALLRQSWNPEERAAGGIVQLHPASYTQRYGKGHAWIEHRRFFTTNPSVYPARICARGWPDGAESEGHFGLRLFESDPALRSAFWGSGEEWVEHIGAIRTGTRY